ncbi:hypothetical protein INT44_003394 [Umbelopsis vinacea]|uniref:Uncharacterized protein n=1 Tax=Umbelopsis vinacea TaxID=44442 RepID=A0A8H7PU72_9FUNG|nr:hypothetical protein INT44_003394 [Umbelopsis vinacea]
MAQFPYYKLYTLNNADCENGHGCLPNLQLLRNSAPRNEISETSIMKQNLTDCLCKILLGFRKLLGYFVFGPAFQDPGDISQRTPQTYVLSIVTLRQHTPFVYYLILQTGILQTLVDAGKLVIAKRHHSTL